MSPMTGGQAPQDVPAREGVAAPKSQRGALVIAGGLVATSVALAVLAAVILFVSLGRSASARQLAAKKLQLAEKTYQLAESQLRPGDCLTGSNLDLITNNALPQILTAVPCSQLHLGEVYYVGYPWPKSVAAYPGTSTVFKVDDARCKVAFAPYDGLPISQSFYSYDSFGPGVASDWAKGDREVVCVAYEPFSPLSFSIKGSGL